MCDDGLNKILSLMWQPPSGKYIICLLGLFLSIFVDFVRFQEKMIDSPFTFDKAGSQGW